MCVTMAICVFLLTVTALIPQNMIRKQSEVSAEFFIRGTPFTVLIGDYVNSIQDNFSDAVLCDIIYNIDTKHPFKSAISAKYVLNENENANQAYYRAVFEDAPANTEYGRYWHGSMVLLRPLLVVMPIKIIRLLYGGLCILFQLIIAFILFRSGHRSLAVCSLLALIFVEPHMFFVSLEYSNIFLVASAAEFIVLLYIKRAEDKLIFGAGSDIALQRGKIYEQLLPIFAAIGVVTFFADFLTTETLTFTLPMMIVLAFYAGGSGTKRELSAGSSVKKRGKTGNTLKTADSINCRKPGKALKTGDSINRRKPGKALRVENISEERALINSGIGLVIKAGIAWFIGYAGMFALKIVMLLVVCGREVMKSSFDEGLFRMGGEVRISNLSNSETVDPFAKLTGSIWHNLACLYPIKTGEIRASSAYIPTLIILILGTAIVYLLHEKIDWGLFVPLCITAALPLLRFLVLSNHSYIHFFFSYRALMVTVAVFLLFVYENGIRYLHSS